MAEGESSRGKMTRVGDRRGGEGECGRVGEAKRGRGGGYVYNMFVMHKLSDAETMFWNLLTYAAI